MENSVKQIGVDFLTVLELSAPDQISVAAKHGVSKVSLLVPPRASLPYYNLIGDTPTRRATAVRCRDLGVTVEVIEPFAMMPDQKPEDFRPALEASVYLGARWINLVSSDTEPNRLADKFGRMLMLADEYGLRIFTEFHRRLYLRTLGQSVDFLREHKLDRIKVEVDALHFFRLDGQVEEIVRLRDWIARAQICDGPAHMPVEDQASEALEHRLPVGEGAFPLQAFVDALPDGITLGIEAPHRTYSPEERVARSVAGTRKLLGLSA
jgi:sugar phosphate isomerase/epimerase